MKNRVYFDSSSTTDIHPEVLKTYIDLLGTQYVNSESLYDEGAKINRNMEKARSAIAGLLGVRADEIIFTGGSSESNSTALKGVCFAQPKKKHIIVSSVEHSSIMNCCDQLERLFGYHVTYLPVGPDGKVRTEDVRRNLREDTALVSVMHVNNETGAVNPIDEIKEIVKKESHAYFHSDLTQSMGKIPVDLKHIDLATISAHKLEGLKGSGLLVRKIHVPMEALICGGDQEGGLRGGTSNAAADMVFARTLRLALEKEQEHRAYIRKLHDHMLAGLKEIEGVEINSPEDGIPQILNFSYEGIPSEVMQNALNREGFMVSARSTCHSRSAKTSYVLKAMGMSDRRASSCIRLSFSYRNTMEETDRFLVSLKEIIRNYGEL
ncbi:MAG: cysteine desulfurase [Solobacterium sp.]|nr:cysteine desulfurase [Solobacterium sp.]